MTVSIVVHFCRALEVGHTDDMFEMRALPPKVAIKRCRYDRHALSTGSESPPPSTLPLPPLPTGREAPSGRHVTALVGKNAILDCGISFPDGHPVPYVIEWKKQVSAAARDRAEVSGCSLAAVG